MPNNPGLNSYQNLRDQNRIAVASGQSNADSTQSLPFLIDHITGRLLVSSTGGGSGLALLTPTSGLVNGSNTTFVWTIAPSIIVNDNGNMMNQTSSDGTVNWTGTTTTVLNQAPNFNIYGLG